MKILDTILLLCYLTTINHLTKYVISFDNNQYRQLLLLSCKTKFANIFSSLIRILILILAINRLYLFILHNILELIKLPELFKMDNLDNFNNILFISFCYSFIEAFLITKFINSINNNKNSYIRILMDWLGYSFATIYFLGDTSRYYAALCVFLDASLLVFGFKLLYSYIRPVTMKQQNEERVEAQLEELESQLEAQLEVQLESSPKYKKE
jgi:hypothetical protein